MCGADPHKCERQKGRYSGGVNVKKAYHAQVGEGRGGHCVYFHLSGSEKEGKILLEKLRVEKRKAAKEMS